MVDMQYGESSRTTAMFQTYEAPEGGQNLAERTARLRELIAKAKLDAVLVPRADEHQGEYVPPSAERLKWLTGFSGSAGLAVVVAVIMRQRGEVLGEIDHDVEQPV